VAGLLRGGQNRPGKRIGRLCANRLASLTGPARPVGNEFRPLPESGARARRQAASPTRASRYWMCVTCPPPAHALSEQAAF